MAVFCLSVLLFVLVLLVLLEILVTGFCYFVDYLTGYYYAVGVAPPTAEVEVWSSDLSRFLLTLLFYPFVIRSVVVTSAVEAAGVNEP